MGLEETLSNLYIFVFSVLTEPAPTIIHIVVIKMNEQKQSTRKKALGFWITISLMVCLIGGLGTYIASTYLSNPDSGAIPVPPSGESGYPRLSLQEPLSATIKQGQIITLQGEHF